MFFFFNLTVFLLSHTAVSQGISVKLILLFLWRARMCEGICLFVIIYTNYT